MKTSATRPSTSSLRERLLAAGTNLLAREGIERVNSNVLARAAGVGIGSFYKEFEDKHEFHRAAIMHALEQLQAAVARVDAEAAPVDAQVRSVVSAVVDFAISQPALFRVAFGAAAAGPSRSRSGAGFAMRATERRLRALAEAGEIVDAIVPALAARGFAAMQGALVLWWLDERDPPPRERLIETLVALHPALAGRPRR